MNDVAKPSQVAVDDKRSGNEVIPPGTLSLPELATQLNYEHRQVKEYVIKSAQHASKLVSFYGKQNVKLDMDNG